MGWICYGCGFHDGCLATGVRVDWMGWLCLWYSFGLVKFLVVFVFY